MGLFSSSSKKSYSSSVNKTIDARIGSEGNYGQIVGQGATVANPASIATSAGDQSTVTQTFSGNAFTSGLTGTEVASILEQQASVTKSSQDASSKFAELALTSLSAAQVGQSIDWKQYIPLAVIGVIAIAALKRRRSK
jgi:hypothetical protein